jgi:DNA-binding response OmpR family regulator
MDHALIIEDDALIALQIEMLLEERGFTSIDIAATEQDAVKAALCHRPTIITSDVRLASGNGPHAVQDILARIGPTPVIFITGSPLECMPCDPPAVILPKPLDERDFERACESVL